MGSNGSSPSAFDLRAIVVGWVRVCAIVATAASSRLAFAQTPQSECTAAFEQHQLLLREGKLVSAREKLEVCARETCPAVVQSECHRRLVEVEQSIPSVVIDARDANGRQTFAVRVYVDGKLAAPKLEGTAMSVDPGMHTFVFEGDGQRIEQQVGVLEGEKNRKLSIAFPAASVPPSPTETSRPIPALTYVFGGLGLVGIGAFAAIGASGLSKEDDLFESCAPNCSERDKDDLQRQYLLADIFLGLGVVSLGTATVLYLTRPSRTNPASTAAFAIQPAAGGARGRLTFRF